MMRVAIALVLVGSAVACIDDGSSDSGRWLGTVELYRGDADRDQVASSVHLDAEQIGDLASTVDAWSGAAAAELSDALTAVDPDEEFVVVIEYDRCGVEDSAMVVDDGEVRFETTDSGWDCASAEDVVEAYAVDWSATGDDFVFVVDQFGSVREIATVADGTVISG